MAQALENNYTQSQPPMTVAVLEERLRELLIVTQSLSAIVEEETLILNSDRPSAIKSLAEDKSKRSADYTRALALVRRHKSLLPKADRALRVSLADATKDFHKLLDRNNRTLARLRKVGEGMIQAIGEEVARHNKPVKNYSRDAKMDSKTLSPTTLSLNETI